MTPSVQPLRIHKSSANSSPNKMQGGRALAEISPSERRRNSPSWNQVTKKPAFQNESSPLDPSPVMKNSPRLYWQNRDSGSPTRANAENRDPLADSHYSGSPKKRSSIENLMKASRVKNSNMFERERSPDKNVVSTRPGPLSDRKDNPSTKPAASSETNAQVPQLDRGAWSDDDSDIESRQLPPGKSLHRHAKSVTFDARPPQINEYEMTTPDPSSVASGSRDGSHDSYDDYEDESFEQDAVSSDAESFDASLEDTQKTPVVLPGDWRFMSPEGAAAETPKNKGQAKKTEERAENDDEEEPRPLPPLPSKTSAAEAKSSPNTRRGVSAAAERATTGGAKMNHSPLQPTNISKSDIQGIGAGSMSLDERLKLMMVDDKTDGKSTAEQQRERRLRRGSPTRESLDKADAEHQQPSPAPTKAEKTARVPRISRESILAKVKERPRNVEVEDESSFMLSPRFRQDLQNIDPDVPLPSTEEVDESVANIKSEPGEETDVDVYAIPDLYNQHLQTQSFLDAIEKLEAVKKERDGRPSAEEDEQSYYSVDSTTFDMYDRGQVVIDDEGGVTPRNSRFIKPKTDDNNSDSNRMSLPEFAALLGDNKKFDLGMESFLTETPLDSVKVAVAQPQQNLARPRTPEAQKAKIETSTIDEPSTPDSVIRHTIDDDDEVPDSPEVPAPHATIKSSGRRLKTRPSATPADIETMAATRRQVSGEVPEVTRTSSKNQGRPSTVAESADEGSSELTDAGSIQSEGSKVGGKQLREKKSSLVSLDLKVDDDADFGSEVNRLLEAQKKGYLMRQNTKMIVASSASHDSIADEKDALAMAERGTRSAGNSPSKASHSQAWTTEPWNGRIRRKSIRKSAGGNALPKANTGGVPPMPCMPSNVSSGLESVAEDAPEETAMDVGEDGERGRLFVKVVRVKDLDLPLSRGERSYFALTLDNGLHCVTTSWMELGKTAPIGQEFELVVLNDLEFQLTLQTRIEEPKAAPVAPPSPTKSVKSAKPSPFSRVFASPKKRREMEQKQQEEAQRNAQASGRTSPIKSQTVPTAWDLLHNLVSKDGSFARSYVCLKDHESSAFGRPYTVEVPCFNEWATEEGGIGGTNARTKRTAGMLNRPPYRIGKLELQLLYIPKPKGAKDEDMPKSMNACIRELREAENALPKKWEGYLSQQGGDCPYWRRRYFSLNGAKFTAYHEATHQPRATINLAKASKLIDDKTSLKKPASGGGNRRRSAFADEDAGYMFVEEGFRIRFANGETIDFYADSAAEKDNWMRALVDVVGKEPSSKSWIDLVLAQHRAATMRAQHAAQGKIRPASKSSVSSAKSFQSVSKSAPTSPAKAAAVPAPTREPPVPVPAKSPRRSDASLAGARNSAASKHRSIVF